MSTVATFYGHYPIFLSNEDAEVHFCKTQIRSYYDDFSTPGGLKYATDICQITYTTSELIQIKRRKYMLHELSVHS